MRITYQTPSNQNFHNAGPVVLNVSGETKKSFTTELNCYVLSPAQVRRVENHFCGRTGCTCNGGMTMDVDQKSDGRFVVGIPVKFCK